MYKGKKVIVVLPAYNAARTLEKTYQEKWYSEDMFVRFRPVKSTGTLKGTLPFEIKL